MGRHENISILFADICKFTQLTTTLSVDKLVETLNDLFGKFDDAADVSIIGTAVFGRNQVKFFYCLEKNYIKII